jgi:hypothetical protein
MTKIRLPIQRTSPPAPFPLGSKVILKVCPDAEPGTVLRTVSRRIEVRWEDINFTGRHAPASLTLVPEEDR